MSLAQLTTLAAETPPGAGGAPLWQLGLITAVISCVSGLVASIAMSYRRGGATLLRRGVAGVERLTGLPGWAAVPGAGAIACAALIITSATWDIGLHIDIGRDSGPLGTTAHYPLMLGLLGVFLMGILAIGLAPRDPRASSPVAVRVPGLGLVPSASVLLLAGSAFGLSAFPLDDLWHRAFGQDVTLWGPTHVMIVGGTISAGIGGALLLLEGVLAAGRNPFSGGRVSATDVGSRIFPALVAAIFLYFWTATLHEFHWGVPQYRQIWQPFLLAFGGAQALVLARLLIGRGGTFLALAIWLPAQVGMSLAIGGPLDVTMPATPLFLAEAVVIELIGLTALAGRPVRFGLLSGFGVGTIGLAAEYGWSQIAMPLAWKPVLLSEAIPVAIIAGLAGGALGATMAQALRGELLPQRRSLLVAGLSVTAFIGLAINAAIKQSPQGVTASMQLSNPRMAVTPGHTTPERVADLRLRISDPALTRDANWLYALGWQGGGRYLNVLRPAGDGSWVTTEPVPVSGTWKTMVRVHNGREMLAAPIRFPADAELGFAGFAAEPQMTRTFIGDTTLMQIERKEGISSLAWNAATIAVLSTNLLMVLLMGFVSTRLGRIRHMRLGNGPRAGSPSAAIRGVLRTPRGGPAPARS